jgi:LysM repeat protein
MQGHRIFCFFMLLLLCVSCTSTSSNHPNGYPTYNPFIPLQGTILATDPNSTAIPSPTRTPGPTPTKAPLSVTIPPSNPNAQLVTSTPDILRKLPTPREDSNQYTIGAGDTLGSIAEAYGISVDSLKQANDLTDDAILTIGQTLYVPPPEPSTPGPSFKIIPDSELVYGPASVQIDIDSFVQNEGGYLANYTEQVNDETLTGAQVVMQVSEDYSVNPRLLLAVLEYRSSWVTNKEPTVLEYPLGLVETDHVGLYHQLTWTANELNMGYYLWRANAIGTLVLGDGNVVPIDPTINAGTAAVQNMLSKLDDRSTWDNDVSPFGLFQTYFLLFGNPFDLAIEPLIPLSLNQPRMDVPFERGAIWAFTGGPHAGWDSGSAWAALDFAPADVMGCAMSAEWVTAVANGFIVRSSKGAVIEDLDGDGFEQTGWDLLYMHMAAQDRVEAGTYVYSGDHIGHPSCEGGIANAAHLHLARKYNGEWIPADGSLPFVLGGWISSGNGIEYDGYLKRGTSTLEAAEGISDLNQISR